MNTISTREMVLKYEAWKAEARSLYLKAGSKMDTFSKLERARADQLTDCAQELFALARSMDETL